MTRYLANHREKLQALERKEVALLRLLERQATEDQIATAAEAVRHAQIAVLKMKLYLVPPSDDYTDGGQSIKKEIEMWRTRPLSDIIRSHRIPRKK